MSYNRAERQGVSRETGQARLTYRRPTRLLFSLRFRIHFLFRRRLGTGMPAENRPKRDERQNHAWRARSLPSHHLPVWLERDYSGLPLPYGDWFCA